MCFCWVGIYTSVRTTLFPSEQDLPQRANRRRFFVETPIGCYPRAYVTSNSLQFQSISGGLVNQRLQILPFCFLRNVSNPKLLGWILSAPPVVRLVIGGNANLESQWNRDPGNVQLWAALSLAFALALKSKPQPRRCGGTTEASCKTSSKGSQALEASSCHNCRASCPAPSKKARHFRREKLPTPHGVIHHRISNHWKKTVRIQQHDDFRPKKNLKTEL